MSGKRQLDTTEDLGHNGLARQTIGHIEKVERAVYLDDLHLIIVERLDTTDGWTQRNGTLGS